MNDFRDFLEESEDIKYDNQLNESAELVAATILGIPTIGLLSAYGGLLVAYGYSKGIVGLVNLWHKIGGVMHELKGKKAAEYISRVKRDPLVKQELSKAITKKREYDDVLKEIYEAIDKKDFITAKEKYDALTPAFRKMPTIKQILINEITKALGEPPMWPPTPGNKTYKTIRNILGLQEAKAAAAAVMYSANKTMGNNVEQEVEESDFNEAFGDYNKLIVDKYDLNGEKELSKYEDMMKDIQKTLKQMHMKPFEYKFEYNDGKPFVRIIYKNRSGEKIFSVINNIHKMSKDALSYKIGKELGI